MLSFTSDYIAGAHPEIMKKLVETNLDNLDAYGSDIYTESAKERIKEAFSCPEGEVFLLTGGTQTNQVVISTMLESYEGVIAAQTGHIATHEAGAIEYSGHKVLTVEGEKGKLSAEAVAECMKNFYADENYEHTVFPGMVYISFPTEYGTIYSKQELSDIYSVCREYDLTLYIDGARLGYGLSSYECDILPSELPKLCDVFYAGGTKVGALCGEAVVFTHGNAPKHFMSRVKQRGALIAKGRLIGIQFDVLFKDGLYFEIGRHAIDMAERLKRIFADKGYTFYLDSPTNQQFIILENEQMKKLAENVDFGFWEVLDTDHTVVRFATSWSTREEDISELEKLI